MNKRRVQPSSASSSDDLRGHPVAVSDAYSTGASSVATEIAARIAEHRSQIQNDPPQFAEIKFLQPWGSHKKGERHSLVRWLAVSLVVRGIAKPSNPEEWK